MQKTFIPLKIGKFYKPNERYYNSQIIFKNSKLINFYFISNLISTHQIRNITIIKLFTLHIKQEVELYFKYKKDKINTNKVNKTKKDFLKF